METKNASHKLAELSALSGGDQEDTLLLLQNEILKRIQEEGNDEGE
jgi:hypothetical protein